METIFGYNTEIKMEQNQPSDSVFMMLTLYLKHGQLKFPLGYY